MDLPPLSDSTPSTPMVVIQYPFPASSLNSGSILRPFGLPFFSFFSFPFPLAGKRKRRQMTFCHGQPRSGQRNQASSLWWYPCNIVVPLLSKLMLMDGTRLIDPASRILLWSASIAEPWSPLCGYHPPPLLPFRLPVIAQCIAAIINGANVRPSTESMDGFQPHRNEDLPPAWDRPHYFLLSGASPDHFVFTLKASSGLAQHD
ncbi:hypothetical protein BDW42DRAFT_16411 [Aspergillus taichungensis]|uniref:Uncharacterized protein n=1 Tax=Aspergillus taichungensis TaxID=482145 RepID=A0A2J5HHY7_9EURO|nr:hypothetical protein BDW42DRAFT_16411 [Aspergillus taichungensis]